MNVYVSFFEINMSHLGEEVLTHAGCEKYSGQLLQFKIICIAGHNSRRLQFQRDNQVSMNLLELKNSKCYFAKHYQRKVNSFTLALTLINLLRTTKSKPLESAAQTLTFVWLNKRISSTKKKTNGVKTHLKHHSLKYSEMKR